MYNFHAPGFHDLPQFCFNLFKPHICKRFRQKELTYYDKNRTDTGR
jgi:hypothetical protein